MAFDQKSMVRVAYGESNGRAVNLYLYCTNDTLAVVKAAGYFADWGSTSGSGTLKANDWILVSLDEDGADVSYIMRVTNAETGTAANGVAVNTVL